MGFDYFYGRDAESFKFIRLPIVLIEDERFKGLSIEAKVLYSMCLSRASLSYKNNWIDENGRVYIYFTIEETGQQLACGKNKSISLMQDLEKFGLIKKRRMGQGNPTKIYVKDFMSIFRKEEFRHPKKGSLDLPKREVKKFNSEESRGLEIKCQEVSKSNTNYIEDNKIDNSYIDFNRENKKGIFKNVILRPEDEKMLKNTIYNLQEYIERLSAYMQSTGKEYKDHASTIMTWYLKDKREAKERNGNSYTGDPSDYDSEWNLNN